MLHNDDIRGLCALPSTPTKPDAGGWDVEDSVDLDEAERLTENLIAAGVSSIGLCGTTGECAALLWEEKEAFVATVVEVARKRVPIIGPATALGTKEAVRQMRRLKAVGADAALVGLPLWQTPTLENSVQFYADLGEALPDVPVMAYANSMFFKSTFPTEFWAGIAAKAPTVVMSKVSYDLGHLAADLDAAGHQVNFMPGEGSLYDAYSRVGTRITAGWSTSATAGPEPMVALIDAILENDAVRAAAVYEDLKALPPTFPHGAEHRIEMAKYNAQVNKYLGTVSGFARFGPLRAPYRDLPEEYRQQVDRVAEARKLLRQKYSRVARS